jgi:hypothetical protein
MRPHDYFHTIPCETSTISLLHYSVQHNLPPRSEWDIHTKNGQVYDTYNTPQWFC